jgi:hypothetical protein
MVRARTRTGRSRLGVKASVSPTGVDGDAWFMGIRVRGSVWLNFAESWRFVADQKGPTPILRYRLHEHHRSLEFPALPEAFRPAPGRRRHRPGRAGPHASATSASCCWPRCSPGSRWSLLPATCELGFLMTLFFTVSCAVQAASGFLVDRYGPRPVLLAGLALAGSGGAGLCRQHQLLDAGRLRRCWPGPATACSTRWTTR